MPTTSSETSQVGFFLVEALRTKRMVAVIDRMLPLDQVAEGHRLLEDREVFGKVIITP